MTAKKAKSQIVHLPKRWDSRSEVWITPLTKEFPNPGSGINELYEIAPDYNYSSKERTIK
jgi:hypothetical protein